MIRGAFEYQGQKCSAASRAYIPHNLWEGVKKQIINDQVNLDAKKAIEFKKIKVGSGIDV